MIGLNSVSRAYRRRKIRQSRVYSELLAPARPDAEALDRALERPAILSHAEMTPEQLMYGCAVGTAFVRLDYARKNPLLVEKLTDEAMMHGSWPVGREYYCEHCPQYGHCGICGQDHVGGGVA